MAEVIVPFEHANIRLKKTPFIPNLGYSSLSTGKVADSSILSFFRRANVRLGLKTTNFIFEIGFGDKSSGTHMLPESILQASEMSRSACSKLKSQESELWYRRLAHMNMSD